MNTQCRINIPAVITNQNVCSLNVTVQLALPVQVSQSLEQFAHYNTNVRLGKDARLQQVTTTAPSAELHDNPQLGAFYVGAMVLGDVHAVQLRHDVNFGLPKEALEHETGAAST